MALKAARPAVVAEPVQAVRTAADGGIERLRSEIRALYDMLGGGPDGGSGEALRHRRELASIEIELSMLIAVHRRAGIATLPGSRGVMCAMMSARLRLRIAALAYDAAGPDAMPDHRRLGHNQRVGPQHADNVAQRYFEAVVGDGEAAQQGYAELSRAIFGESDGVDSVRSFGP